MSALDGSILGVNSVPTGLSLTEGTLLRDGAERWGGGGGEGAACQVDQW